MSTIEYKEKSTNENENIYDNDSINNICDVMGRNVLLWFIPMHFGNNEFKGYEYQVNKAKFKIFNRKKMEEAKRRDIKGNVNFIFGRDKNCNYTSSNDIRHYNTSEVTIDVKTNNNDFDDNEENIDINRYKTQKIKRGKHSSI